MFRYCIETHGIIIAVFMNAQDRDICLEALRENFDDWSLYKDINKEVKNNG